MTDSRAMNDETRQILEMLAEGKVTPEQAAELLDAVDDRPGAPTYTQSHARSSPLPSFTPRSRGRNRKRERRASPLDELAQARLHGVDADYVQEMRDAGYDNLTLEELTELRIHGIHGDFVAEMRELGLTDLSAEELVEYKVTGLNAEYIQEMRALGFLTPHVEVGSRAYDESMPEPTGDEAR